MPRGASVFSFCSEQNLLPTWTGLLTDPQVVCLTRRYITNGVWVHLPAQKSWNKWPKVACACNRKTSGLPVSLCFWERMKSGERVKVVQLILTYKMYCIQTQTVPCVALAGFKLNWMWFLLPKSTARTWVSHSYFLTVQVGMNTILVRFASGGIKKLEHGTVVRLSVEDKFTLSTIYYEFQLLQSEPSEDEVDVEAEETLRFIPKMPQAVLDVPNNTPQSLSDIGLSRLPSVLAALPQHSAQFRPKPAGEPLTPTNTPQTATSQSSNPITPQASVIFTPQTSANPSRAPSIVGDFDLLENDDEGSNTGLLPPLPPPKMTAEQQRILQSTSANDLFLTSDTILKQVQNPLQLHYEQTLQPCEPEVSSDPEDSSDFEASKPTLERQSSIDPKLHLSKEAFAEYQCSLQVETDEEFSEASEPKTEIKE